MYKTITSRLVRYISIVTSLFACLLFTFLFQASSSAGPLDLNWQLSNVPGNPALLGCENTASTAGECNANIFGPTIARGSHRDSSGIVLPNERAQVLINGQWYWHLITGDPSTGFAQELMIQTRGAPGNIQGAKSASAGRVPNTFGGPGNGQDPLAGIYQLNATETGTGTAHPRRVILRQINVDGEMDLDFRKGIDENGTFQSLSSKPVITQTIANSELTGQVTIDMSSLNYNDMSTAAPVVNTLVFTDPLQEAANFDMSTDAEISTVSAGRYIFVDGGPQNNALEGLYFYADGGGYDVWGVSGFSFRNDAENGGPYAIGPYPANDPNSGNPLIP